MTPRDNKTSSNGTDCTTWKVHSYLLIVIRVLAAACISVGQDVLSPALSATSASATYGAEWQELYIRLT
jgi:hypothetical protein